MSCLGDSWGIAHCRAAGQYVLHVEDGISVQLGWDHSLPDQPRLHPPGGPVVFFKAVAKLVCEIESIIFNSTCRSAIACSF
jgi:hypothetical protein